MPRQETGITAIAPLIRWVRGQRVILDSDLAPLYGATTSRLNQQVRRNHLRFPPDFAFVLSAKEAASMLLQNATASRRRNLRKPPVAFTEYGAVMAANVLNSDRAVSMSVEVVRTFIALRRAAVSHERFERKLSELETLVMSKISRHDSAIRDLFHAIEALLDQDTIGRRRRKRIGFL